MSKAGPALAGLPRRGAARLFDVVWLGVAEQRARSYAPADQQRIAGYHAGALARLAAARDLRDAARIAAAGAVYREAARLAAYTVVASTQPGAALEELSAPALFAALRESSAGDGLSARRAARLSAGLADAEQLLTDPDPLALDRADPTVAVERLDRVHAALEHLLGGVEARSPRQVRRSRWLRLAGLAVTGLIVVTSCFVYALSPANVARGKRVDASAHDPRSPPLDKLVNGEVESPYGSSTGRVKHGWFRVDLGKPHEIVRIEITNRRDRWDRESTPFALELSNDGERFREVTRFTDREPQQRFVWKTEREVARYVRAHKLDHRGLALSEIEVFGFEQ